MILQISGLFGASDRAYVPSAPSRQTAVGTKPTALKPRDPNATAAAAAAVRSRSTAAATKSGSSLSSLLQSRSELASAKRSAPAPAPRSPLPDIDSKDKDDPLAAADYAQDIYCYYRRVEPRFAVPADYMRSQVRACVRARGLVKARAATAAARVDRTDSVQRPPGQARWLHPQPAGCPWKLCAAAASGSVCCVIDRAQEPVADPCSLPAAPCRTQAEINEKMRSILIDWLVEVHLKFKLMPETLYLTVNLIDRYLAKRNVTRKRLQLVGVTAMLIASKYEEIWAPEVRDFVYISDKAYSREDILKCEKTMLEVGPGPRLGALRGRGQPGRSGAKIKLRSKACLAASRELLSPTTCAGLAPQVLASLPTPSPLCRPCRMTLRCPPPSRFWAASRRRPRWTTPPPPSSPSTSSSLPSWTTAC
jgi:hypothetical protein